jgi:ABC-2 type transport system ATP-binding protein
MSAILEVKGLNKSFVYRKKDDGEKNLLKRFFRGTMQQVHAVQDLDLRVEKGELLAFIGPNGAGKSTTIKLITGILYPDSGSISLLGKDPHKNRRHLCKKIGTVFGQKSQLWFHLPARDSLRLLGTIYDLSTKESLRRIDRLSDEMELGDFLDQPVRKLSLGQRIRCEIAASLIHEPELIFLDEPSIGLDVVAKQRIRELIQRVNREQQVTVFLTSHDVGDIEKLCKRAVVINQGRSIWDGSIKDMKYRLLNRRILDVKIERAMDFSMDGVKFLKNREFSAKLEVDLTQVELDKVIQRVLHETQVLDMAVNPVPMEEIITQIYQGAIT